MEGQPDAQPTYERNEQLAQDVEFVRAMLQITDTTRVLRWRNEGESPFVSAQEVSEMRENVALHAGQMGMLAIAVIEKARVEDDQDVSGLDIHKVNCMVFLHDAAEIPTGDAKQKDEQFLEAEAKAQQMVKDRLSALNFGDALIAHFDEYEAKSSQEARFVKAMDELQAMLYMIYTRGFDHMNRDLEKQEEIPGLVCAQEFVTTQRISKVLVKILQNPGLIKSEVGEMQRMQDIEGD